MFKLVHTYTSRKHILCTDDGSSDQAKVPFNIIVFKPFILKSGLCISHFIYFCSTYAMWFCCDLQMVCLFHRGDMVAEVWHHKATKLKRKIRNWNESEWKRVVIIFLHDLNVFYDCSIQYYIAFQIVQSEVRISQFTMHKQVGRG